MTGQMTGPALIAGGTAYALPPRSAPLPAPVLRAVPGGAGRLFVGMVGRRAVPAWLLPGAAGGADAAWALVPDGEGTTLLGGDAFRAEAPGGSVPAPPPDFPAAAIRLAPSPPRRDPAGPAPGAIPRRLRLWTAGGPLDLPFDAVERVVPMPPLHPAPDAPPGAGGFAWTETGPALVTGREKAPLLVLLVIEGRRLGLPCARVEPGSGTEAPHIPDALRDPRLLAAAPVAVPPAPVPAPPTLPFLLARAGTSPIAFVATEVTAVLPPRAGAAMRGPMGSRVRGLVAHRGEVLPVLDAGERLGRAPVLSDAEGRPSLRLATIPPFALAVTAVDGFRAVLASEVVDVPGEGMTAAVARIGGEPVPVLRPRALAAALSSSVAGGVA